MTGFDVKLQCDEFVSDHGCRCTDFTICDLCQQLDQMEIDAANVELAIIAELALDMVC